MIIKRDELIEKVKKLSEHNKTWRQHKTTSCHSFTFKDKELNEYVLNIFESNVEFRVKTLNLGFILKYRWDDWNLITKEDHDAFVKYLTPYIFVFETSFKKFYDNYEERI